MPPKTRAAAAEGTSDANRARGEAVEVKVVATAPIEGQVMGTSGMRKPVSVASQPRFIQNWIQALFNVLSRDPNFPGCTLVLGGDGRYFNEEALQIIIQMARAAGVGKLVIGQHGFFATPSLSSVIVNVLAFGGLILTASHNPGGPNGDWGIKYNPDAGQPAPEKLTAVIDAETKVVSEYRFCPMPPVAIDTISSISVPTPSGDDMEISVVSSTDTHVSLLRSIYDFEALRRLIARRDFSLVVDSFHGVGGVMGRAVFVDGLGADPSCLLHNEMKKDFGGLHPDPNLTYASDLVAVMKVGADTTDAPALGIAFDGDADRNMILGAGFFVTPSDSLAVITEYAPVCIPYFAPREGETRLPGVSRSMPTSTAVDRVAAALGIQCYEVPTGWKFFCNLMDDNRVTICGEESFGTGACHVREKDGIWAALAWLSILAYRNPDASQPLVGVRQIVEEHWLKYGRSYYVRYDYENIADDENGNPAKRMYSDLSDAVADDKLKGTRLEFSGESYVVARSDQFCYTDPVDGSVSSNQGARVLMEDGSRIIFRLSGTGSLGATVRIYLEKVVTAAEVDVNADAKDKVKCLAGIALQLSKIAEKTGRDAPTVIT